MVLANLGIQAQRLGDAERALPLFGASEALREAATGSALLSVSPAEYVVYKSAIAAARATSGESKFDALWQSGRELALPEAMALGRRANAVEADRRPSASRTKPAEDDLTPREREVALLIAGGRTNREIADVLVISEWTVDTHVRHILTKLGQRSRAQIAAWVAERRYC
jgi:non-specific serine/threonine protein kinase